MQYRHLGKYGVKVSEVALGSWLTYGGATEDEAARACIEKAYDLGINFFDTANVYARGKSEEVVGKSLAAYPRDSYFLATKVFFPMGDGPNDRGLSRKHIFEQCHLSLKRLGTDYIDLYQCHRYDTATPLEETLVALDDLARQGKILYAGVSEWSAGQIAHAVDYIRGAGLHPLVSNQPYYNMIGRGIEKEVIPLCEREGIGQVVFSPLAQGVLTGKYKPGQAPPGRQPRRRPRPEHVHERRQTRRRRADQGPEARRDRPGRGPFHGAARPRLVPAPEQRQQRHHRRVPPRPGGGQRGRVGQDALRRRSGGD